MSDITFDKEADTLTMNTGYFAEVLARAIQTGKKAKADDPDDAPSANPLAQDAATRREELFPNANRLDFRHGHSGLPRTSADDEETEARFPNAGRLNGEH